MDPRLFGAARSGDVAVLRRLYAEDPNHLNSSTPHGNTALHLAVIFRQEEFAKELCSKCPSLLSASNGDDNTPLLLAAAAGLHPIVAFAILPASHPDDVRDVKRMLRATNKKQSNALHEALKNGHGEVALELARAEPELARVVNGNKESPLYMACYRGLEEVVVELLRSPKAYHEGPGGRTALHAAVSVEHSGFVKLLLQEIPGLAKKATCSGDTPLHFASRLDKLAMVQLLLDSDASLAYAVDNDGRTPIMVAASLGHVRIVEEIARRCPDSALMVSRYGNSALHLAAEFGHAEVVEYILRTPELERLINQPNNRGDVPLHVAAREYNAKTLRELLACERLDSAVVNDEGRTAVEVFFYEKGTLTLKWLHTYLTLGVAFPNEQRLARRRIPHEKTPHMANHAEMIESLNRTYAHTTAVVAIIMATVTFAAAFTDQGLPIVARKAAIKAFLISDTVALCASLAAAFICIWAMWNDSDFLLHYMRSTRKLLWCGFVAMLVAFVTGLYTAVAPAGSMWLAATICVLPLVTYLLGMGPTPQFRFPVKVEI